MTTRIMLATTQEVRVSTDAAADCSMNSALLARPAQFVGRMGIAAGNARRPLFSADPQYCPTAIPNCE
jgi:hypothetical protein